MPIDSASMIDDPVPSAPTIETAPAPEISEPLPEPEPAPETNITPPASDAPKPIDIRMGGLHFKNPA